ncbi:MAG TPA: heme-binding protein, partial [Pirellulales bacterium]
MSALFHTARRLRRWSLTVLTPFLALGALAAAPSVAHGDAQWIWYPEKDLAAVPSVHRYFRKTFDLGKPESGSIELTCDDEYELFVNGKKVGADDKLETLEKYDLKSFLVEGRNVVAIRAHNTGADSPAGLAVRLVAKSTGATDLSYASDGSWKCNSYGPRGWETAGFNDAKWLEASTLGELGQTLPWKGKLTNDGGNLFGRFTTPAGFKVERLLPPQTTGSLLTLAFNERGDLLAARERGPIVFFPVDPGKGLKDEVKLYSEEVTDCQGILPLNGYVYAVGKGKDGPGLYRLTDKDFNGQADECETLFRFQGEMAEHGPHNLVLGPEGLIYIAVGNHSLPDMTPAPTSPYKHWYEGDLLQPRYEDPGGHAVGVKAPGGVVLRTDADGTFVEFFAGGLRNFYDISFDRSGELFTFDSDMEWDVGLPWFRPARVNHLTPGSESGWRSGWATWPAYFIDSLPASYDYGRGSPAGMVFYDHDKLPAKYKGALISCDWSQGKIVAVHLKKDGATFSGESEVLVEGRPLNAVDVVVGPDGALYFATGGRSTEGGVYRLSYEGKVEPPPAASGVLAAIRQPQMTSAWGRDKVASLRAELGDAWPKELAEFVKSDKNAGADRARGLDLMQLVGPFPSKKFLVR